ncbi:hypothetical protein DOY81_008915 [Sarcophaga bullata]|nr:hypothetical protein DOY81_008915 [Sarcophaga bullata]
MANGKNQQQQQQLQEPYLLGGNVSQTSSSTLLTSQHNAPSPLSGTNENSLSPSGGSSSSSASSVSSSGGGTTNGPLSPGAMSQTSAHNAASAAPPLTSSITSNALANCPEGPIASASMLAAAAAAAAAAGSSSNHTAAGSGGSCCENGRPIMTDPVSGQTVCSCQYDSARLALSNYSRMPSGSVGVYGTAYPSTEQNPYPSISVDSSAFYTPLSNPYSLKESTTGSDMSAWSTAGLQPTTGYYSYDPTICLRDIPFREEIVRHYGASYDLASRRKNATRESTATLKAWLNEHKKNPYPTKGEKIMLAIITKMTLTQVSTWFANARRRLKKENKMTWEPKNQHDLLKTNHHTALKHDVKEDDEDRKPENLTSTRQLENYNTASLYGTTNHVNPYHSYQSQQLQLQHHQQQQQHQHQHSQQHQQQHTQSIYYQQQQLQQQQGLGYNTSSIRDECGIPIPATKPKIWSVADTVANKTPPPPLPPPSSSQTAAYMSNSQQQQLAAQSYYANNLQINNHLANNSPLSMMSSYVNTSTPYSRLASGYATAGNYASPAGQMVNSSNTSANMMHISQQYAVQSLHNQQQQQQQQQQHQHQMQQQQQQQQQGRLGFPEIQPDTPPQTPPNMKHNNTLNSLSMGNNHNNNSTSSSSSSSLAYGTANANGLNTSYGSDASSQNTSRSGLEMQ